MNMTEEEYIIATNRVKISLAKTILKDVLPSNEYGITEDQLKDIVILLDQREMDLFSLIILKEDN